VSFAAITGFSFTNTLLVAFSSHIYWLLLLLLIFGAIGVSAWAYRSTIPPVSRRTKILLITLRSITLVLLVVLIAEPMLRISRTFHRSPVLAIVADNTLSMTLTDGAGSRDQQLRRIFADASWDGISRDCVVKRYSIAPTLLRTRPDSLVLRGASTDLSAALAALLDHESESLRAVILLSDGNYNIGANPLTLAERFPVPIFTVGIGDSSEQKDVVVTKIDGNAIAYLGSSVPVDATIKISGYTAAAVQVIMLEDGKQIGRQTIAASSSPDAVDYPVHFLYEPKTEGLRKITVRSLPLPGEATEKNNSRSFTMKVLKNKMRTVVLAGAPGPDAAAVMQTLESDKNAEPSLYYQTANGRLLAEKTSATLAAALGSADCIVLIGFPTQQSSAQTVQAILAAVRTKALPLFFVSGRTIDLEKLKMLEPVLPFIVSGTRTDEQQVMPAIPAGQRSNILISDGGSADAWEKLPPIYSSLGLFKAKPEAAVLATMKLQGVTLTTPLVVSSAVGRQKSFAVLGYGIARWKLLAGASTETASFFTSWFSAATRWLAVREEDKRLRVEPDKEIFSQGEPAAFSGQAYTETYDPLDNAGITVDAVEQTSREKYQIILAPSGSGRYEGAFANLAEGEYDFTAAAAVNGTPFGSVRGRFSVGEQSLEFTDTKMNSTLMRQIASLSGGRYAGAQDYRSIVDQLTRGTLLRPEEETGISEVDMWSLPLLFAVILLSAGCEWFIRKQTGMV
jgi:hypothetical protein